MTEPTMRERVARAIGDRRALFQLCDGLRHDNHQVWHIDRHEPVFIGVRTACLGYIDAQCAEAAIAAMREPTDFMVDAVETHPDHFWANPRAFEDEWVTAIDAVLAEKADG